MIVDIEGRMSDGTRPMIVIWNECGEIERAGGCGDGELCGYCGLRCLHGKQAGKCTKKNLIEIRMGKREGTPRIAN